MELDYDKIISYLEGKLSPEETTAVETAAGASDQLRNRIAEVGSLLARLGQYRDHKTYNKRRNWYELDKRIKLAERRRRLFHVCRNAAAVVLLPLLCFLAFDLIVRGGQEHNDVFVEQTSASGLVSKITLPDGSTVWLNSGSKLTYPAVFREKKGGKTRGRGILRRLGRPEEYFLGGTARQHKGERLRYRIQYQHLLLRQ